VAVTNLIGLNRYFFKITPILFVLFYRFQPVRTLLAMDFKPVAGGASLWLYFKLHSSNFKLLTPLSYQLQAEQGDFFAATQDGIDCVVVVLHGEAPFTREKIRPSNVSTYCYIFHGKELLFKKKQTSCIIKVVYSTKTQNFLANIKSSLR
jgi:hypothetical protein